MDVFARRAYLALLAAMLLAGSASGAKAAEVVDTVTVAFYPAP